MSRAKVSAIILMLLLFTTLATSCGGGVSISSVLAGDRPPTPIPMVYDVAEVEEYRLESLDTRPPQVNVIARGMLPDTCTQIGEPLQWRSGSDLFMTVQTARPLKARCPAEQVPYEAVLTLDTLNLYAGIYVVEVNGMKKTLALQHDHLPDPGTAVLGGRVWHDSCNVSGGEGDQPAVPGPGCVLQPDGSYIADGLADPAEPGLGGVLVEIGAGSCPSSGLATAVSDDGGHFAFPNLLGGTYCLTVNALSDQNAPLLIPGQWTYPGADGQATVELPPGETLEGVHFGWDHQFTAVVASGGEVPVPAEACRDAAVYVADVTVPDDSEYRAGATFTKTWRLLNSGDCTWGSAYALVYAAGEPMAHDEAVFLSRPVAPGEEVDLSVAMTAPAAAGTYRSDWMLRNAAGAVFGLGEAGDKPFWVQIVVVN